jgi:hypothetical protein
VLANKSPAALVCPCGHAGIAIGTGIGGDGSVELLPSSSSFSCTPGLTLKLGNKYSK